MKRLSPSFLAEYKNRPDPFKSLLARSVVKSKYLRKEDDGWAGLIQRVVEGNCSMDRFVTVQEAEFLYDTMYNLYGIAAGRGLYTNGTGIVGDAAYNCRITGIRGIGDWGWIFRILMCGSGIGVDVTTVDALPCVQRGSGRDGIFIVCRPDHPNLDEVRPDACPSACVSNGEVTDDREGWAQALAWTLQAAWEGQSVRVDVSRIRSRGEPLKTFGGVASGPGPLADLLRKVYRIVRKAAGRKITEIEALDITTLIGLAVKAGNVRRAALLVMGSLSNQEFLDAKLDFSHALTHRQSANNSVRLGSKSDVDFLVRNAHQIAERVQTMGEPAFINISKFRETDPNVICTNACSEIGDWYRGACCLGLLNLPKLVYLSADHQRKVVKAMTRYLVRERMKEHSDTISEEVRKQTMRIGLSVTGVTDVGYYDYRGNRALVDESAREYAQVLGVAVPIATTCVQPAGTTGIVTDTSPGMHASWSEYMIRRTRVGIEEPMAGALIEASVPFEYDVYDPTQRTLVFEFPVHRPGKVHATTETTRSQLERQLKLQEEWASNAVSGTISFPKGKTDELAGLIAEFVPKLKCSSFLPNDGGNYKQAPLEAITKEDFERRHAALRHDHPLVWNDDAVHVDACSNGACPVR